MLIPSVLDAKDWRSIQLTFFIVKFLCSLGWKTQTYTCFYEAKSGRRVLLACPWAASSVWFVQYNAAGSPN